MATTPEDDFTRYLCNVLEMYHWMQCRQILLTAVTVGNRPADASMGWQLNKGGGEERHIAGLPRQDSQLASN